MKLFRFVAIFGILFLSALRAARGADAPLAPPLSTDNPDVVALYQASGNGDWNQIKTLVDRGTPLDGQVGKYRFTPLIAAVYRAHLDVLKYLIDHHANLDFPDQEGSTALLHACSYDHADCALALIAAGANVNFANNAGRTPLIFAAMRGNDRIVENLIAHHVDVNYHDPSAPALFYAVVKDHVSTAKLLLDAGADPSLGQSKATDPNELITKPLGWLGWTDYADPNEAQIRLMAWAAATNDPAMVDLLLDHGLNVNSVSNDGMTVLINAVESAKPAIIAHLLDKGADPNLQQDNGRTPLTFAVNYQQEPVLQSLLDHGAKMEMQDKKGRTALIWACYYVKDPAIRFLVDHGANINATDLNGETPLTYAGDRGDMEIVKFLQDKRAARTDVHVIAKPEPQPPLSPSRSWALAVGAIYAQTNGYNPHMLGYDDPEPVEQIRADLKRDWDITDQASFLTVINDLIKTGQRTDMQADGIMYTGLSDVDFSQKLLLLDAEKQVEAKTTRSCYLKWKEKSGLAWDLCRAANLINFGFAAHYIDEQKAWPLLMDNARQVQGDFNSWQEMSDNFLDGREIWATGVETKYEACSQLLCNPKDPNSPWNQLPWKTDLTAN